MRFLFKLDDNIEVNIRQVIMNDEDSAYTTTGIYFGSEAILRIRNMLKDSTLKAMCFIFKLLYDLDKLGFVNL